MTGQDQKVSCIPVWVIKDIKSYIKKSSYIHRRSQSISPISRGEGPRRRLRSEERPMGRPLRVAVIGGEKVGKSALTVRFLTRRYIGEYQSDSDILYRSVLRLSGSKQSVELLDCSGEDLKQEVLDWAEAFIVVYSITDLSSLPAAEAVLNTLQGSSCPVLLCGNKVDLDHQRMVNKNSGVALSAAFKTTFAEVSAAEDFSSSNSVNVTFESLLKEVKQQREQSSPRFRRMSPKVFRSLLCRNNSKPTELIVLNSSNKLSALSKSTHL